MNLEKIRSKKSLKFLILLLTSLMIAGVSAATYRYMYIDGTVTVGGAKMVWLSGTDTDVTVLITGASVELNFPVENGTQRLFNNTLYLKNQDSSSHTMNISITTPLPAAGFNSAVINIYQNSTGTWALVDTLDMTTTDSTINQSLAAGNYYRLAFDIYPKATASGSYTFDVQLQYE